MIIPAAYFDGKTSALRGRHDGHRGLIALSGDIRRSFHLADVGAGARC